MNVPEDFHQLCGLFYPHSNEEYATEDEWIAGIVHRFLRGRDRKIVKAFLDELLSGQYTDAELERVWQSTSPTYGFRPGGHRIFLTKIRDLLGS
jgi:hypothetical protein